MSHWGRARFQGRATFVVEGAGEEEGRKGGINDQTPDWVGNRGELHKEMTPWTKMTFQTMQL